MLRTRTDPRSLDPSDRARAAPKGTVQAAPTDGPRTATKDTASAAPKDRAQAALCHAALLGCCGLLMTAPLGCSTPSAGFTQCQAERDDLARRLAEEQRVRRNTEAQLRQAMARLAESEKQLARHYDQNLADGRQPLPRGMSADRRPLPASGADMRDLRAGTSGSAVRPTGSPAGDNSPQAGISAEASGWRPTRQDQGP